jgi:hypothetical protein
MHDTQCVRQGVHTSLMVDPYHISMGQITCTPSDLDRDIRHLYTRCLLGEAAEESICHEHVTEDI